MSYRAVRLLSTAAAGASLAYVYQFFVLAFLQRIDPSGLSVGEQVVVVSQVARLVAVFVLPRLRRAKAEVIWTIFSLETFAVVVLMGIFVYTSDPYYAHLVVDLFSTWITALLLLTPAYTIFRLAAGMVKDAKLWYVFVSIVSEFAFLAFLNSMLSQLQGSLSFGDFLTDLILNVRGLVAGGKNPITVGPGFVESTIILYVALLVYAAVPSVYRSQDAVAILAPALLATLALFGWVSLAAAWVPDTLFSLTVPAIALTLVIWWSTNEK